MENKRMYKICIRLLIHRSENDDSTVRDIKMLGHIVDYETQVARDLTRGPSRMLKILYLDCTGKLGATEPVIKGFRRRGGGSKYGKMRVQDWDLFREVWLAERKVRLASIGRYDVSVSDLKTLP
jgi:hypothetical protein